LRRRTITGNDIDIRSHFFDQGQSQFSNRLAVSTLKDSVPKATRLVNHKLGEVTFMAASTSFGVTELWLWMQNAADDREELPAGMSSISASRRWKATESEW
jgi:hypothetical protein